MVHEVVQIHVGAAERLVGVSGLRDGEAVLALHGFLLVGAVLIPDDVSLLTVKSSVSSPRRNLLGPTRPLDKIVLALDLIPVPLLLFNVNR